MEQKDIRRVLELSFVIVVAVAMLLYGIGKPIQFSNDSNNLKTIPELSGMELMWAFYGYSKTYPILLGIGELGGALLLCLPRTRVLGCLLLTAILSNVIIQDIVYGVNEGALRAAVIYQVMIFAILWFNRAVLIQGIQNMLIPKATGETSRRNKVTIIAASILLALLFKAAEFYLTH